MLDYCAGLSRKSDLLYRTSALKALKSRGWGARLHDVVAYGFMALWLYGSIERAQESWCSRELPPFSRAVFDSSAVTNAHGEPDQANSGVRDVIVIDKELLKLIRRGIRGPYSEPMDRLHSLFLRLQPLKISRSEEPGKVDATLPSISSRLP